MSTTTLSTSWGTTLSGARINWLFTDQLGTPRMVFDKPGSLAAMKRHDYAPFGEELLNGARTTAMGYAANDTTRQQFTSKERDNETGLDYSINRYYSSTQGRFTSEDPLMASARAANPQTHNRYAYTLNNPLRFVDPTGLSDQDTPDYKPEFRPCTVGADAGCSETNTVLGGVTINTSEGQAIALETTNMSIAESLMLNTGQIASDTVVGAGKFGYNTVFGTANMINAPLDYGLSFFTDFQFGQNELYQATTAGESGAMYGMMIGSILAGGAGGGSAAGGAVLTEDVASTFANGYRVHTLESDVTAFRFSGGTSDAAGRFLTTRQTVGQIGSPAEARSILNLPAGNTAETLNTFTIPRATTIFTGRVAGGGASATQIFIRDPSVLIPRN